VAFKPNVHRGVGGLTLRFTRIDARSKSFLDKATALREQRRPSSKPPTVLAESASPEPEPLAPPPPPEPVTPAAQPKPALEHTVMVSAADFALPPTPAPAHAPAPANRDALLERLRTRAKALDPAAVQRILEGKAGLSS
jgi:hypothetical protein